MRGSGKRGIVYMLAKTPQPGFVKTRLCPPLDPKQAASLAAASAADTLTMLTSLTDVVVRLALDEGSSAGRGDLESAGPAPGHRAAATADLRLVADGLGVPVVEQGEGDLGVRMAGLLRRGLADGLPTILLGSDAPDLPAGRVADAFQSLECVDVVIVPAVDGGYVLIGARRPLDAMFEIDAPWSSEQVLEATLAALGRTDATWEMQSPWEDVDDAPALGRLAGRLLTDPVPVPGQVTVAVAVETVRLLKRWRKEGVRF